MNCNVEINFPELPLENIRTAWEHWKEFCRVNDDVSEVKSDES